MSALVSFAETKSDFGTTLPGAGMVVVVDSGVDNYQQLLDGVLPGAEVYLLQSDQDGIEQITQLLTARSGPMTSLHLVSHGAPGTLYLGNSQLSLSTLTSYAPALQHWFAPAAHANATLLLYGCNVAAGDAGVEFMQTLHRLSGVSIAASQTYVGNKEKGGS